MQSVQAGEAKKSNIDDAGDDAGAERILPQAVVDFGDQPAMVRIVVPNSMRGWRSSDSKVELKVMKKTTHVEQPQANQFDFVSRLPVLLVDSEKDHVSIQRFSGEVRFPSNLIVRITKPMTSSALKSFEVVDGLTVVPFDCIGEEPTIRGSAIVDVGQQDRSIAIDSAWLQSISNAVERRERLVLQFQTKANSIALKFPVERRSNSKMILNGVKARVIEDSQNPDRIEVLLPSSSQSGQVQRETHVLEIFTWPSVSKDWVVSLRPELPTIENSKHDFPIMWQIIVPSTSHLVGNSEGLSPGYSWS
jgi:hypothetical protein